MTFLVLISHDLKWAIITHKLSPNFVLPSSDCPKWHPRFYRKYPMAQHLCKQICGVTKPMLVLLGGHLLSGPLLWEALPALNPRHGVHPCSVSQALTSVDFSLPCVTWEHSTCSSGLLEWNAQTCAGCSPHSLSLWLRLGQRRVTRCKA